MHLLTAAKRQTISAMVQGIGMFMPTMQHQQVQEMHLLLPHLHIPGMLQRLPDWHMSVGSNRGNRGGMGIMCRMLLKNAISRFIDVFMKKVSWLWQREDFSWVPGGINRSPEW
mmetsp:Transcript_20179/g.37719  ORF Transcript_20179/g.37719 Transcript_20179/m.37719 type:complete len:113 (-) Transcript_20179:252-590(-)